MDYIDKITVDASFQCELFEMKNLGINAEVFRVWLRLILALTPLFKLFVSKINLKTKECE